MSKKTESEILFETFCDIEKIRWERIEENDKETPDYEIYPNGLKTIAEVKQIEPNPAELEQLEELKKGGFASVDGTPGDRIRKKIAVSGPQIRSHTLGIHPSILVIYNTVAIADHTQPYTVRVAMYGLETIVLSVPKDMRRAPHIKDKKFGPKRKMTAEHNNSISAVAILERSPVGKPLLRIYHNSFADIPLDPSLFRSQDVKQFTLKEKETGKFQNWKEI